MPQECQHCGCLPTCKTLGLGCDAYSLPVQDCGEPTTGDDKDYDEPRTAL